MVNERDFKQMCAGLQDVSVSLVTIQETKKFNNLKEKYLNKIAEAESKMRQNIETARLQGKYAKRHDYCTMFAERMKKLGLHLNYVNNGIIEYQRSFDKESMLLSKLMCYLDLVSANKPRVCMSIYYDSYVIHNTSRLVTSVAILDKTIADFENKLAFWKSLNNICEKYQIRKQFLHCIRNTAAEGFNGANTIEIGLPNTEYSLKVNTSSRYNECRLIQHLEKDIPLDMAESSLDTILGKTSTQGKQLRTI